MSSEDLERAAGVEPHSWPAVEWTPTDRKPYETPAVLEARRRLADAMHAMHADQRIRVDVDAARELEAAWNGYDAALLAWTPTDAEIEAYARGQERGNTAEQLGALAIPTPAEVARAKTSIDAAVRRARSGRMSEALDHPGLEEQSEYA